MRIHGIESMSDLSAPAPVDVLLVEDDPGDAFMTLEALESRGLTGHLHLVADGVLAMEFLRRRGQFAAAPRPSLVLLDLNLPRRSGLEVLAEMKTDRTLLSIPVVVFTSSQAEQDIVRSYALHANAYVTKPLEYEKFDAAIRQIDDFFLSFVQLPM
jgi:CheY-like chemotaxis protein